MASLSELPKPQELESKSQSTPVTVGAGDGAWLGFEDRVGVGVGALDGAAVGSGLLVGTAVIVGAGVGAQQNDVLSLAQEDEQLIQVVLSWYGWIIQEISVGYHPDPTMKL